MNIQTKIVSIVGYRFKELSQQEVLDIISTHPITLTGEPENEYDENAIAVYANISGCAK